MQAMDHKKQPNYHYILHTVPYECETQPIEKLWNHVKSYVAEQFAKGRKMEELRSHTKEGFYGCGARDGVSAAQCQAWINHSKKEVNIWIRSNPNLRALWPPNTPDDQISVDSLDSQKREAWHKRCIDEPIEAEYVDEIEDAIEDAAPDLEQLI
jgi:hypothetical protein